MDIKIRKINNLFGISSDANDEVPPSFEEIRTALAELRTNSDYVRADIDEQEVREVGDKKQGKRKE